MRQKESILRAQEEMRKRLLKAAKRRRVARRADGLCVKCGKIPPREGRTQCEACTLAVKLARRRHIEANADRLIFNGKCDLCEEPLEMKKANLDHCHASGVNRGWLCTKCNLGLGMFRDSPTLLRRAVEYIVAGRSKVRDRENVYFNL